MSPKCNNFQTSTYRPTLTHSQRIFASLQYAGATARCKHCRHIESANRKWSYNIHGRPIVFNLTRENE